MLAGVRQWVANGGLELQNTHGVASAMPLTPAGMGQGIVPRTLPLLCHWSATDTKRLPLAHRRLPPTLPPDRG